MNFKYSIFVKSNSVFLRYWLEKLGYTRYNSDSVPGILPYIRTQLKYNPIYIETANCEDDKAIVCSNAVQAFHIAAIQDKSDINQLFISSKHDLMLCTQKKFPKEVFPDFKKATVEEILKYL